MLLSLPADLGGGREEDWFSDSLVQGGRLSEDGLALAVRYAVAGSTRIAGLPHRPGQDGKARPVGWSSGGYLF